MRGSFFARTEEIGAKVGDGVLTGQVGFSPGEIAGPQHLGGWITGPLAGVRIEHWTTPGTGPDYLSAPLLANFTRYYQAIADLVLTIGPRVPMEAAVDDLLATSRRLIPRETGVLADSGRAEVDG